jgi:hypothetical protein
MKLGRAGWSLIIALSVVAVPVTFVGGNEIAAYFFRNPDSAQEAASRTFVRVARQMGEDPQSFEGPVRLADRGTTFVYQWTLRNEAGVWIEVDVSYLPHDVTYTASESLVDRQQQRCCRLK